MGWGSEGQGGWVGVVIGRDDGAPYLLSSSRPLVLLRDVHCMRSSNCITLQGNETIWICSTNNSFVIRLQRHDIMSLLTGTQIYSLAILLVRIT